MQESVHETMTAVLTYINANGWEDAKHILEKQQDQLLADTVDQVFAELFDEFADDKHTTHVLTQHHTLLRAARVRGISVALNEHISVHKVADAVMAFINAASLSQARRILKEQQEILLTDTAEHVLSRIIQQNSNDNYDAFWLNMNRTMLRRARIEGIEATDTFGDMPLKEFLEIDEPRDPKITDAVLAFINAQGWEQTKCILDEQQDLLLTDLAQQVFVDLLEQYKNDVTTVQALRWYRALLNYARLEGIDAAFEQFEMPQEEAENTHRLIHVFLEFVHQPTWIETQDYLQQHLDLLTDEADQIIETLIKRQPDENSAQKLIYFRSILRQCRSKGIDAVFAGILGVIDFIFAGSLDNAKQIFEAKQKILLTDAMDLYFSIMIQQYRDNDSVTLHLFSCYCILRYVPTKGIDDAFAHQDNIVHTSDESLQRDDDRALLRQIYTRGIDEAFHWNERFQLLIRALMTINRSMESQKFIHSMFRDNLDKLDDVFAEVLYERGNAWLSQIPQDSALVPAAAILLFCMQLEAFPLGNKIDNLNIVMAGCDVLRTTIFTREARPVDWAMTTFLFGKAFADTVNEAWARNLEIAINCYRDAINVISPDDMPTAWAGIMQSLGKAYAQRLQDDRARNLEEAINCFTQALQIRTQDKFPMDWAETVCDLGNAYSLRIYEDLEGNLNQAIECYNQAAQFYSTQEIFELWAKVMQNIGLIWLARYERLSRDHKNLEHAIDYFTQALQIITQDKFPVDWAETMHNLGSAYCHDNSDKRSKRLELAVDCFTQALQVRTQDKFPVDWAETMHELGFAYADFDSGQPFKNLDQAIICFEQALLIRRPYTMPAECRQSAYLLGKLLIQKQQFVNAVKVLREALRADEFLYQSNQALTSKEILLSGSYGLYATAAYAFTHSGYLREAVVTLEQGRARIIGETMARDRANLDTLHKQDGTLAQRYEDAAVVVRSLEQRERNKLLTTTTTDADRAYLSHSAAMSEAIAELWAVITKVRQIPGYETFLTPTDWKVLTAVVQPGIPLVYPAVVDGGSFVLIVYRAEISTEPVITTVLNASFTTTELTTLLIGNQHERSSDNWVIAYGERYTNPDQWYNVLERVTHELWEQLIGPLMHHLKAMNITQAVLIPSGFLALLPLHAAWTDENGQRHYAMDTITFTYMPAARILAKAKEAASRSEIDTSLLIIQEPQPVQASQLHNAYAETEAIITHFAQVKILPGEKATREAAQEQLTTASIAHFSCHGTTDWENPLQSGLLMAQNEMLTVQDIFSLQMEASRLAVLSACETGIIGTQLPDEVAMLPSALMLAGFAGVISSLWSVNDASTAILMERFYYFWRFEQLAPANALRQAQLWLRDTSDAEKRTYYEQFIPEYGGSSGILPEHIARFFRRGFVLRKQNKRFAHPYYWAAFYYMGV